VSPPTTLSPDRSRQNAVQQGTAPGKAHLKKYTFTMGTAPLSHQISDLRFFLFFIKSTPPPPPMYSGGGGLVRGLMRLPCSLAWF
jgi:hypothetical protein